MSLKDLNYVQKWFIIGALIGVIAGFAALLIFYSIRFVETLFLSSFVGFTPPVPLGETGGTLAYVFAAQHYFLLPVSIFVGALISGYLVYKFAPETEGHGTDAVIRSFHNKEGASRARVPLVKLVTAALTIGSGGSGGREGPTAQITAGLGHILAKHLNITKSDRRTITAVAMGAGIGTIFKAPFGGALLAAEILYRHDMEVDAIFPGIVASIIGFTIFGAFTGYTPMFGVTSGILGFMFNPFILPLLLVLGVITGLFARLYVGVFYYVQYLFRKLRTSNYIKPAIGALGTAAVVLIFPEVAGVGYGWTQLMISGSYKTFINTFGMPLALFFLVLAIAKIVATSTSIASGGSGGVFSPGIFTGASVGIFTGLIFNHMFPAIVPLPLVGVFAIIGMLSFFGAAGKVPIAVTVMVLEMTGSLAMLPAAMFSIALALIVSGNGSIYNSQVNTRRDSPAHIEEYYSPLMKKVKVSSVMNRNMHISPNESLGFAERFMKRNALMSAPVVDGNRFLGAIYMEDAVHVKDSNLPVKRFMKHVAHVNIGTTAESAWHAMIKNGAGWCAVLDSGRYVGAVEMRKIFRKYR